MTQKKKYFKEAAKSVVLWCAAIWIFLTAATTILAIPLKLTYVWATFLWNLIE